MSNENWKLQFDEFIKNFFIWVNEKPELEKYTFHLGNPEHHYTIRVWNNKREVDLHLTNEKLNKDDPNKYKTLFKISFYSLKKILVLLKQLDYPKLFNSILNNKISVGKLNQYKCLLIPINPDDPKFNEIYKQKKGKNSNRIKLNKDFDFLNLLSQPITPEDGLNNISGSFMVLRRKKMGVFTSNGFVYRLNIGNLHGSRTYLYFSKSHMKNFKKSIGTLLYNILSKVEFENKKIVLNQITEILPNNKLKK